MMIIKKPLQYANVIDRQGNSGVFDTMTDAIRLASSACEKYSKYSLAKMNDIIDAVIIELESHLEELISMACKETGLNAYDDILNNNTILLINLKNTSVNKHDDSNIVNGIIISSSNSIETLIKHSISSLNAGHAVVFSSNKNVKHVFAYAVQLINNAIEAVNGPKNLIVTVKEPSNENTKIMIENEQITLLSNINNNSENNIAI